MFIYLIKYLYFIVIHLISENCLIWSLWHGSNPESCNSKGCILSSWLYSSLRQTFYFLILHPVYYKGSDMESLFLIVLTFLLPFPDKVGCIGWNAGGLFSVSFQVGHHSLHTCLQCASKVRPLWKKSELFRSASLCAKILHLRSAFLSLNWIQYKFCLANRKLIYRTAENDDNLHRCTISGGLRK